MGLLPSEAADRCGRPVERHHLVDRGPQQSVSDHPQQCADVITALALHDRGEAMAHPRIEHDGAQLPVGAPQDGSTRLVGSDDDEGAPLSERAPQHVQRAPVGRVDDDIETPPVAGLRRCPVVDDAFGPERLHERGLGRTRHARDLCALGDGKLGHE